MLLPAMALDMAMGNFRMRRGSNVVYDNVKAQILTSQRVIGIDV